MEHSFEKNPLSISVLEGDSSLQRGLWPGRKFVDQNTLVVWVIESERHQHGASVKMAVEIWERD